MDAMTLDGLLTEITLRIQKICQPERIILFGSHARGNFSAQSDLDILVILDDDESAQAITAQIYRALADLPVPIDVVVMRNKYVQRYGDLIGTVARPALREGKVLYAR